MDFPDSAVTIKLFIRPLRAKIIAVKKIYVLFGLALPCIVPAQAQNNHDHLPTSTQQNATTNVLATAASYAHNDVALPSSTRTTPIDTTYNSEEEEAKDKNGTHRSKHLNEVVVDGRKTINTSAVSIGKVPIAPMDLPQSIAIIGQEVLRDQQAQRLSDVIKNVNGVYLASSRASTQENFSARGYSFSSNNMFKDGTRVNSGIMPEMSSLERVEILKGSSAILYGNVAPGGIINMVTKQPKFERGGEVAMRIGSYHLYKPSFDIYGPLSKKIAYRVNGTYEYAGSYRDIPSPSKRYYINPSLLIKASANTEVLVQADYLKHDFAPDFGIGTYNNTIIPNVPRATYYGTPWQYSRSEQTSATASVKHSFNEQWQLNGSLSYQLYNRDYFSTERIQALANGDWARPINKQKTSEQFYIAQINLTGRFNTAGIRHTLLAGADVNHYRTELTSYNQPKIYDTINILDPNKYTAKTDMPVTKEVMETTAPVNRLGIYVQDLIAITSKINVLAGVRWSYQQALPTDSLLFATNTHQSRGTTKTDQAFSPRIGLVYKPFRTTSVFVSYSNSFNINTGTDVYGNALAPSIIDQYEAGVKNDFFKGMLSTNLTVYRIINNNLAQVAAFGADGVTPNSNTSLKELTGQTKSDGIELDVAAHPIKGLDIYAGASYNYIRYTQTPDAKGNYVEGERLINNPAGTGNASIFYTVQSGLLKRLKIGASGFYTGRRYAGFNNTKGQSQTYARNFEVPEYTTFDFSMGYSYQRFSLLAKVSNLTNVLNYNVHENYSVNPIAPRQVIATLNYTF